MKVLITGGAGFIGSHLADKLIEMGCQVSIIDNLSTGKLKNINPSVYHWNEDLNNIPLKDLISYLKGVKYVFHLAAKTSVEESIKNPLLYLKHNIDGMTKLLTACSKSGVKRFIFSSSSSVYGKVDTIPTSELEEPNPISPYALSKLMGEQLCEMFSEVYNIDTVCLRYFNAYGDRMNEEGSYKLVIPIFSELIKQGKPCTIVNDGNQRRDFIHVEDIVNANIRAATTSLNFYGESYNIGSGKNYSVNELADVMGGEKIYGEKRIEPFETLADIDRAKEELGWSPKINLLDWLKIYMNGNKNK
tara:strand:+ start:3578 stop:4486 length:909 start_codon:yes stop_codon:yes gene_type:complete